MHELFLVSVGDGRTDHHILLAAVFRQERRKSGVQSHEKGGAGPSPDAVQASGHIRVDPKIG